MNPFWMLCILLILPVVLFAAAHFYGSVAQDARPEFDVVLIDDPQDPIASIIDDHVDRFGIRVTRMLSSAGYTARIPKRHVGKVRNDERVRSVTPTD